MDMSMSMPTASPTGTGMAMPSSTADMSMMGMDSMKVIFFTSTTTPLWSSAFTPHNAGQYAGVCIFLIVFAMIFRLLLAARANLFTLLSAAERRSRGGLVAPYATEGKATIRPWRAREALIISTVDVVIAGVGYLLMLAVMTLNVGYFLSILGGVFLGSMFFGRLMGTVVVH